MLLHVIGECSNKIGVNLTIINVQLTKNSTIVIDIN